MARHQHANGVLCSSLHILLPCALCRLQHIDGYCAAPHSVCFASAVLDEQPLAAELLAEPTRIALPRTGLLKVGLCTATIAMRT